MADTRRPHVWGTTDAYEAYMGRWSRPVAEAFLAWLAPAPGGRWMDVGCGTGALTQATLTAADPLELLGVDPSPEFIGAAAEHFVDPRVRIAVGDARELAAPNNAFDVVVAGLVLNFVPEPKVAVAEMARVARRGGTVAAYVWDYAGDMQLVRTFWQAATALDPAATAHDQSVQFPMCQPEPLASLFAAAGLQDVVIHAVNIPTVFRDFNDYWRPHLMGGSAVAQRYVASLGDGQRAAPRERLLANLPIANDESIPLLARAGAVRGTK